MVKRNSNANDGSLDLLLDTLTNSFGAFLLVALLIALLVTDTSQSEAAPSDIEMRVLENLELEIDTFLQQAANLQKRIDFLYAATKNLPSTISEEEVHLLRGQLAEISELRQEQTDALNRVIELNAAIVQLADEIADKKAVTERENKLQDQLDSFVQAQSVKMREIKEEVESAQRLLLALRQQLAQKEKETETGKQHREVLFPRVSSTSREQFAMILKAGWLYNYNPQHLVQSRTGYFQIGDTRYRLTKGIKVAGVRNIAGILNVRLAAANIDSDYIKIFVWDDTFASWNGIRMELARRGFKYQLVPMDNTLTIVLSDAAGRVQ